MIRGIIFPTQDGVGSFSHSAGDPGQMRVQRPGVGEGQHEARSCGAPGADGTEDAAPLVSRVAPGPGPCAASGPDAGQSAVLTDPRVRREIRPPHGFLARLTPGTIFPAACPAPVRPAPACPAPVRPPHGFLARLTPGTIFPAACPAPLRPAPVRGSPPLPPRGSFFEPRPGLRIRLRVVRAY